LNTNNRTLTHIRSTNLSFRDLQGEKGDYFYVVNTGRYEVYLTGIVEPVTSYEHPALFGELACLYSSPRAATVKAVSGGSLWRVDRATFRGLLLNSAAARLMRFLRSVPVLTTYSEHALTHLATVCVSLIPRAFFLRAREQTHWIKMALEHSPQPFGSCAEVPCLTRTAVCASPLLSSPLTRAAALT